MKGLTFYLGIKSERIITLALGPTRKSQVLCYLSPFPLDAHEKRRNTSVFYNNGPTYCSVTIVKCPLVWEHGIGQCLVLGTLTLCHSMVCRAFAP